MAADEEDDYVSNHYNYKLEGIVTEVTAEEQAAYVSYLHYHLVRMEERLSLFSNAYQCAIQYMEMKTEGIENGETPLLMPQYLTAMKYFDIDFETDGMQEIQIAIKQLERSIDEIKFSLHVLSGQSPIIGSVPIGTSNDWTNHTIAYVLDGVHELRRLMDNVLGKTRDPLTLKQSLYERHKMRERRTIPDSASAEVKRKAFIEELHYTLPGGFMELLPDMFKIEEQNGKQSDGLVSMFKCVDFPK
jgi:hypothetical protein